MGQDYIQMILFGELSDPYHCAIKNTKSSNEFLMKKISEVNLQLG